MVLLRGRGFELHDELGGYPAAVFDVDALASGPVADFGGVRVARAGLAAGPGWALSAGRSPGRVDIAGERAAQRLSVLAAEVDLVACAALGEPEGCARQGRSPVSRARGPLELCSFWTTLAVEMPIAGSASAAAGAASPVLLRARTCPGGTGGDGSARSVRELFD